VLLCVLVSQMGYGQQKTGPIPANSWLEFDVSAARNCCTCLVANQTADCISISEH
jgi:hypothetical protein